MWKPACQLLLIAFLSPLCASEPDLVVRLVTDGDAEQSTGDFQTAIRSFEEALKLARVRNENDFHTLRILDKLASAYQDAGDYADAQRTWQGALALTKKQWGCESLQYGIITSSLTTLPTNTSNDPYNLTILKRIVLAHRQPPYERNVVTIRTALAQLLIYQNKFRTADEVVRATLNGLSPAAKANRLDMATLFSVQGSILNHRKRYKEALTAYLTSLQLQETERGKTHPNLVLPLNNVGATFTFLGDYEAANLIFKRALYLCYLANMRGFVYGVTAQNYSILLKRMGRKGEARNLELDSQSALHDAALQNGIGMTVAANP